MGYPGNDFQSLYKAKDYFGICLVSILFILISLVITSSCLIIYLMITISEMFVFLTFPMAAIWTALFVFFVIKLGEGAAK